MKKIFCFLIMISIFPAAAFLLMSCGTENPALPMAVVGKPAPDFSLTDTNGKIWTLSELRGQAIFVNFWATWCPPCRQELPSMQTIHQELSGKGFQMLTILVNDDPNQAVLMTKRAGFTFPILVDSGGKAGAAYGITGVPETFIVDAAGILREKVIGPKQWDAAEAKELILKYIP